MSGSMLEQTVPRTTIDLLFQPLRLRSVEFPNRIVFLPHVTMYAEGQRPSRRHRDYYAERARGGVGLIVTESQFVHPTGGHGKCVFAGDRAAMAAWRETIEAVASFGARIFAQLTHHGLEAFTLDTMLPQWGPSAVANPAVGEIPKAMTVQEIREVEDAFRRAAGYAVEAGFDGVELKVAHDGILRTFLSPYYNRRTDEYGATTPENRLRFVLETLEGVRTEIGDRPLGIRYCVDERLQGGYDLDEGIAMAAEIASTGLVDYISADMGTWVNMEAGLPPASVPEGYADAAVAAVRKATGLPVVAFGRIVSPGHAASLLANGTADFVGMARQLIADPEWPRKVAERRPEDIRPCVHCNQECVGRLARDLPIGCVHNPAAGREGRLGVGTLKRVSRPRKVVVVGGGPAGLKVAEVAAARGHRVILFERAVSLGGQVALAASVPGHDEWGEIATHLIGRLERLGVDVRTGQEATARLLEAEYPDAVVLATGSRPRPAPFAIHDRSVHVVDEWTAVTGPYPAGARVAVFDLGVRFEGAAVVEALVARQNAVTWISPKRAVGADIDPPTLSALLPRVARHGVVRIPETVVVEVRTGAAVLFNVFTARREELEGLDALVVVGNKVAENDLHRELANRISALYEVGDCVAPRHVAIAIHEAEIVARGL